MRVEENQKVISTGPYALVRHPLYVGAMLQFLATPLALGSWWGLVVVPPLCPVEVTPYDFSQTATLISRSEHSTDDWLRKGGLHSDDIPHSMIPHNDNDDPDAPYLVPSLHP